MTSLSTLSIHANNVFVCVRCSAQNKSENSNKTGTRVLGNQVIRKGHMCIQNLGIMKGKFTHPQVTPPPIPSTGAVRRRSGRHLKC